MSGPGRGPSLTLPIPLTQLLGWRSVAIAGGVLAIAHYASTFSHLTLAFVHVYLDALFRAFKNPHVRRMLAPHLTQGALARR